MAVRHAGVAEGISILLMLCLSGFAGAAPAAQGICQDVKHIFPGLPLGAWYSLSERSIPVGSRCKMTSWDECAFVSRDGVSNSFSPADETEFDRRDRILQSKSSVRAQRGWLPFGVRWTDDYRTVFTKVKPHGGVAGDGGASTIRIRGCTPRGAKSDLVEVDVLDFNFERDGRLSFVQAVLGESFP